MKPVVRAGAAHGYVSVLEDVRRDLVPALAALERVAAAPESLEQAAGELPNLQYALYVAGERVLGLEPLPGLEQAHEELSVALAIAREETADVLAAVDGAEPAAEALVWEWRASLFGVRLALRRAEPEPPPAPRPRPLWHAWAQVAMLVAGVLTVLGGALAEVWPVWAAGLGLVAVSTGLSRRP